MYSLGIDIGYSSVKLAVLDENGDCVFHDYRLHKGRMDTVLIQALEDMAGSVDVDAVTHGALVGNGCKALAGLSGAVLLNEVACLVEGAKTVDSGVGSVMEIGGQGAKYVTDFKGGGQRIKIAMNPSCSAGTGSFLEEQASRLGLAIEDYSGLAEKARSIPRIAGRCSVFAKTDITHHQQEGAPVEDILQGLAHATVRNYRTAVMRRLPRNKPVLFAGGVALNSAVLRAVSDVLKLDGSDLIVPSGCHVLGAMGAALMARAEGHALSVADIARHARDMRSLPLEGEQALVPLAGLGKDDASGKHDCPGASGVKPGDRLFLGVDVGSTSTNAVLMAEDGSILAHRYLRTMGRPRRAVAEALRQLGQECGPDVEMAGVCVTGSGRYMIGRLIGADVVKDEITAQAKAAVTLDPGVDTVFEIGGQDSKFISLENGVVVDFQMNRICAAGTGSFLEEQAKKLDLPLDRFGEAALRGGAPTALGERCTVFIESAVAAHLARGAAVDDLAAGLCHAIVRNYLHRVVGRKRVGQRIFFQGGVAFNQGVVNAFRVETGKDVTVPPFFSVTGAYGAALLAREEMVSGASAFKGFDVSMADEAVDPGEDVSGGAGEFDAHLSELVFRGYTGELVPGRRTIGMPRALFTYGMYPMFGAFFQALGCNVLLSDPTSEETVRLCQECSLEETCFPVKLVNGHMAQLVERGVDWIFFPDLHTVMHPGSRARENYGCPYMQLAFKLANQALELDGRGIGLLAPTIAFGMGPEFMKQTFMGMGAMLGRTPEETAAAMGQGMRAYQEFERAMEENARDVERLMEPGKKTFVLISKIYGVADPFLNLGIPDRLRAMGHRVLPFCDLPEVSMFGRHPNMFWPFGQHILEAARLVREHPNLYAIFLTHHGCGPDTVFTHYFKEIMEGKPYLNIEVDEHSSAVGVITRLEAFVNSLDKAPVAEDPGMEACCRAADAADVPLDMPQGLGALPDDAVVWLPNLFPYAQVAAQSLRAGGVDARVMPATDGVSVDMGRARTMTNEYFSMTALLGDALRLAHGLDGDLSRSVILAPQSEGAEVDAQYARLLRCKLDEAGFAGLSVASPFLEDLPGRDPDAVWRMFACLLAGDIVLAAPGAVRRTLLDWSLELAGRDALDLESLRVLARHLADELAGMDFAKRVLVVGEPLVLFNDHVNDRVFARMEDAGHRVVRAPLSECLWMFWKDHLDMRGVSGPVPAAALECMRETMRAVAAELPGAHFVPDADRLSVLADRTVGHYAGAFGRYRQARIMAGGADLDGVIHATSMYENTGITLGVLAKGRDGDDDLPVLNLTFDGTGDEADAVRLESFLHYI